MSAVDELEDDVFKIIGILLLLLVAAMIYLSWLAWKETSVPAWAYPDQLFGDVATGVDTELSGFGLENSTLKGGVDQWLGGLYGWIVDHLPTLPAAKLPQYSDDNPATATTGGQQG